MSEAVGQSLSLGQRSDTPHSNLAVAGYGPLEQALQGGSGMSSRVGANYSTFIWLAILTPLALLCY